LANSDYEELPLTADQCRELATICFAQALATLNPEAAEAFFEAGKQYRTKAKALGNPPDRRVKPSGDRQLKRAATTMRLRQ
jgi:hypothetical protein